MDKSQQNNMQRTKERKKRPLGWKGELHHLPYTRIIITCWNGEKHRELPLI